jgi:hypothetical protein
MGVVGTRGRVAQCRWNAQFCKGVFSPSRVAYDSCRCGSSSLLGQSKTTRVLFIVILFFFVSLCVKMSFHCTANYFP